jgi:hypothetical protein
LPMTDEQQQLIFDYKAAFNTDAGVAVLKDLSRFCLERKMTADINSVNQTYLNEGLRTVIRYIREKLESTGEPRQQETKTDERTQL